MADNNQAFANLFGALATPTPKETIPQAPINYGRINAILNSGVLKNPNASMAVPDPQPTTPAPAPKSNDPMSFLNAFFSLIGKNQDRLRTMQEDEAFYRRMNNLDGGS